MLTLLQDDVMIDVRVAAEGRDDECEAIVRPATDRQRHDLGRAAVGQAWMAWTPTGSELRTIKFMPPKPLRDRDSRELLKSYRFALRVAETYEVTTLALPLPEQAGLSRPEEVLEGELIHTLLGECGALRHLRHLRLHASGEQEAVRYADRLADHQRRHGQSA
ncbi:hypothetical protein QO259_17520 [Salinicola sp. JS01]|uniref:hypothetical protein n=1 Tax=Salinicola sp. JS01 TaxID=3050071 RepID=UPI00255C1DC9|nr:hypothetical protein [Salinicola sp. JS01]WIX32586.1 hypothetical protein QO259_17520 [Salinicola sp. JS01]